MTKAGKRKLVGVTIEADDLLHMLLKHGYLDNLTKNKTPFPIPDDVRVTAVAVAEGQLGGAARLQLVLESDIFGDEHLFDGGICYFYPTELPPALSLQSGLAEEVKRLNDPTDE